LLPDLEYGKSFDTFAAERAERIAIRKAGEAAVPAPPSPPKAELEPKGISLSYIDVGAESFDGFAEFNL